MRRARLRRCLPVAAALAAAAAACTSVAGLTGGPTPAADAGTPDATVADAPPPPDTGAPDARDATSICADHWLCDDFEGDAALDARWSIQLSAATATTSAADPATPSPPTSLAVALEDAGEGWLTRIYSSPSAGVRCRAAFRAEARGATGAPMLHVEATQGTGQVTHYYFDLVVNEGARDAAAGFTDYAVLADGSVASGAWKDVGPLRDWNLIEVTLRGGADGGVAIAFNGAAVPLTAPLAGDLTGSPSFGAVGLRLGPQAPAGGWRLLYDDVVCDPL
jgi:hypothetical protein